MRGEIAGAGGPNKADNLIKFPGGHVARAPELKPVDPGQLIEHAGRLRLIGAMIESEAALLRGAGFPLRPGLAEWLDDTAGRLEYRAAELQLDADEAAGVGDVA